MVKNIICLRDMCAKWWLERVQHYLRRDTSKPDLFGLQRYLSDLPREIRSYIIHNALKAGGLHLAHGSKEIPAVNRSLVFLSSDITVREIIYVTFLKSTSETIIFHPDLELLIRTSVTKEGEAQLLSRLPSIISFGNMDVIESIQSMAVLSEDSTFSTAIEEINIKCATVGRIQDLKKYCPNLKSIKVTFQEQVGATLNDLRLLKNLNHIDIIIRDPFLLTLRNFNDFVWDMGNNLKTIKVCGDIFWEADLGALAGQCPHIQNISLPAVTVPTKESLTVLKTDHLSSLTNLRELVIDCMSGICPKAWAKDFTLIRLGIVLALKRCTSLKKLVLRPTCLVDADFMDIFSTNSLLRLEVLELYNCTLSLMCAKMIVDTCINLHVMKGLRTWRGITLHELVLLRKYTRGHRRAADLKIIP
ncbi:hypothetical protein Anas_01375 [Armadillidium nasatum]|uniref:Uncharacterized protein n=1 Tax=Armadillidium nasatum TaxID=96803 RepID=A0A5N5TJ93_9CRUS|nr:hypothetical protein Anas_01375 [Armadillidium nasatum]